MFRLYLELKRHQKSIPNVILGLNLLFFLNIELTNYDNAKLIAGNSRSLLNNMQNIMRSNNNKIK